MERFWPYEGNTGYTGPLVDVEDGADNPPNAAIPADNIGWAYSKADGYITVASTNAIMKGVTAPGGVYVP